MSQFLHDFVVGIDVSSEFSIVAMLAPSGELIRKPFRIDHNPAGFHKLLDILKKEEERLERKPIYFVESTGIFHLPLFFFLRSNDLQGFVLNPLSVHSIKNFDLRKVKNDQKDAEAIARLAKYQDVKFSLVPEPQILALRMMTREYYALSDTLTEMKNRLCTDLYLLFPGFLDVFSNIFGKTALTVLKKFPSPRAIQAADTESLTSLISKISRKGTAWAEKKVNLLKDCAQLASSMPHEFSLLDAKIKVHIDGIKSMQASLDGIVKQIHAMIDSELFPADAKRNIELLDGIPGIGFLTAATLIAEMGDFSLFKSAKAFTAFFGIDPSVNQSGKFQGDRNKISKRGTRIGRRILFTIAMASIRTTRKGDEINPVLREFYAAKCVNKKKKVALVAVMHKLLHYIFAVLRDQKPFEIRQPKDHQSWRNTKLSQAPAA
ncbi:transposase [Desulfitobacterium dichloroeliminans LMG P-21439]|uniref:Transposase n=1 Tax=Desulfitobacterium dichloroeliminans (strain LMG P-21439 / DCA1) TaxID=871963 RepID=L0F4V9_DESDL|nr:IS110 family transposase [Desulfitobacterium dichloroeliminans]AGA68050.1 transposase [Desulfitobacterium dichloroeliminans LMG P-21439]AGA68479.1 transposase [Desulfitobacterium dichloroeliminans LMG P-21439]AGA69052.1 transposase [Desulfitobacterium dichloroeliminans LMG P-21439]AGA69410.1 transposase [Desulfitobacterium dichloroeliminans LMG P-21439]